MIQVTLLCSHPEIIPKCLFSKRVTLKHLPSSSDPCKWKYGAELQTIKKTQMFRRKHLMLIHHFQEGFQISKSPNNEFWLNFADVTFVILIDNKPIFHLCRVSKAFQEQTFWFSCHKWHQLGSKHAGVLVLGNLCVIFSFHYQISDVSQMVL